MTASDAAAEIELRGVEKRFATQDGEVHALARTDLAVRKGELLVLLGPSGCGKTTLLRMIGGLLAPSGGEAMTFGQAAARYLETITSMKKPSAQQWEARRLAEWIERRGGVVTVRDVTHGIRAYRNDPDTAEHALSELVEAGIGRWEADDHGPRGGRPARRFRLVSAVTVTETKGNTEADAGSGDGDAGDTTTDADDGWAEL